MLELLFWFITFPFVLAFVLGFMSYGISEISKFSNTKVEKAANTL